MRDVLHRAGIWERLAGRIHATPYAAVEVIRGTRSTPDSERNAGIDEGGRLERRESTHA